MPIRTVSANLKNHIAQNTTTVSYLWKITRTDSNEYFFTDADSDIEYNGDTYKTVNSGELSGIEQRSQLNPDNFDFQVILNNSDISKSHVVAGLFDHATVEVFLINRKSVSDGVINLIKGRLGEVQVLDDYKAIIEFRSLAQLLSQSIGRTYGHECDADLGDTRCGVTLASYTHTGSLTAVTNNQEFADNTLGQTDDYFNYGLLTWTSGNNNGLSMEVKDYKATGGTVTLVTPMPFTIATGDAFSVYRGCDKTKTTCINIFSNVINFRGFAEIPGMDLVNKIPDINPNAGLHD